MLYPCSIDTIPSSVHHILESSISHKSVFSTTSQVMCRSRLLPKVWIQLSSMALSNWIRKIIFKFELRCNLELNWIFRTRKICRDIYLSSTPPGFSKIYSPGLPPKNGVFAFNRFGDFQHCLARFPSLNNKRGNWAITKLPVRKARARYPFGRASRTMATRLFMKQWSPLSADIFWRHQPLWKRWPKTTKEYISHQYSRPLLPRETWRPYP